MELVVASFSMQYVAFTTLVAIMKEQEIYPDQDEKCPCLKTETYAVTVDLF